MASRYWVPGGTGNWSSTTNWSATSGGTSGASVPTSADDAFVNPLSGTSPSVNVDAASNCLSLDFTGAITPTFTGTNTLSIFGSLTRIAAMTFTYTGAITFAATSTGKTVTSAGGTFAGNLFFDGVGGGWTLQDDLTVTASFFTLSNGTFNTNGKTVTCKSFGSSNSNTRTLTLGASIINVSVAWSCLSTIGLTFNAGTSRINLIVDNVTKTFTGGGLTYNVLNVMDTPAIIVGSNTFASLSIDAGKTLRFTSGTTQTITSLVTRGTTASPSILQSTVAGSAATIALPAARHLIRHASAKDITVSGATSLTDIAGINVSGNTGITFVTKFEMGRIKNDGSLNWYSKATGTVDKVSG